MYRSDKAASPAHATLLNDPDRDDFERGSVDGFWVSAAGTGDVEFVILESDNSGTTHC